MPNILSIKNIKVKNESVVVLTTKSYFDIRKGKYRRKAGLIDQLVTIFYAMEESPKFLILQPSLLTNIYAEKRFFMGFVVTAVISFIAPHFNPFQLLLLYSGMVLLVGVVFLGFVAILVHVRYYFHFERARKVELHSDRLVVCVNDQVTKQIMKNDVLRITLYNKRYHNEPSSRPICLDDLYYLTITAKNQQQVILTSLLDIALEKKITDWYGQDLKHIYQFIPIPGSPYY